MNLGICSSVSITAGMIAGRCAAVERAESITLEACWKADNDTVAVLGALWGLALHPVGVCQIEEH